MKARSERLSRQLLGMGMISRYEYSLHEKTPLEEEEARQRAMLAYGPITLGYTGVVVVVEEHDVHAVEVYTTQSGYVAMNESFGVHLHSGTSILKGIDR